MWRPEPLCLLALAWLSCSRPDPAPVAGSAPASPPTSVAAARASVPPPDRAPEPTPVEDADRPDAGAPSPRAAPLSLGRPALVDFSRADCFPCQLMKPWLAELRRRHAGAVEIVEVDLDRQESRGLARYFKARSVPMQVYVDAQGREAARNVGLATLPQMQRKLEQLGFTKRE